MSGSSDRPVAACPANCRRCEAPCRADEPRRGRAGMGPRAFSARTAGKKESCGEPRFQGDYIPRRGPVVDGRGELGANGVAPTGDAPEFALASYAVTPGLDLG